MQKRVWPKITEFLSLSNSETKGAFILLFIIVVIIVFNLTLPLWIKKSNPSLNKELKEDIIAFNQFLEASNGKKDIAEEKKEVNKFHSLSPFNPNTVSEVELLEMGFPARVARTLINYRNAGGKFATKNDLLKVYGIEKDEVDLLYDYIVLPENISKSTIYKNNETPIEIKEDKLSAEPKLSIEINSATAEELQKLSGIGPSYSKRIVKFRDLLGGFYSTNQLYDVYNLPEETVSSINEFLVIDTSLIEKIKLKNPGGKENLYHPYLTEKQQNDLYLYLQTMKRINHADELLKNNILDKQTLHKISPYLDIK